MHREPGAFLDFFYKTRLTIGFGAISCLNGHSRSLVSLPPVKGTVQYCTEYLEIIVDEAEEWLKHSGSLVLEMAPHHVDAISERMLGRGYSDVQIFQDLSGRNRGVVGKWN